MDYKTSRLREDDIWFKKKHQESEQVNEKENRNIQQIEKNIISKNKSRSKDNYNKYK